MSAVAEMPMANVESVSPAMINRLAIVVREDSFDSLLSPLTFAWEMARKGVQVDMLFVLWTVKILTVQGVNEVRMNPRYSHREQWLRSRLSRDGDPLTIHDFLRHLVGTGNVNLHACRIASVTFDVEPSHLIPEATGIIDPGAFLNDIALQADHCQYF
jgi:peroxiredoxin family protein